MIRVSAAATIPETVAEVAGNVRLPAERTVVVREQEIAVDEQADKENNSPPAATNFAILIFTALLRRYF